MLQPQSEFDVRMHRTWGGQLPKEIDSEGEPESKEEPEQVGGDDFSDGQFSHPIEPSHVFGVERGEEQEADQDADEATDDPRDLFAAAKHVGDRDDPLATGERVTEQDDV